MKESLLKINKMNKLKITTVLVGLILFSCTKEDVETNEQLIDNSHSISKMIESLDYTLQKSVSNPSLNDNELQEIFLENAKSRGLRIIKNESQDSRFYKSQLSEEYYFIEDQITTVKQFSSKAAYKDYLIGINDQIITSDIQLTEKQWLTDEINFMIAFLDWMESVQTTNAKTEGEGEGGGWWDSWGQCVAGTVGGYLTGGLGGCGIGAGVGVAVGGPVGAAVGCAAGGAVGAVGGALTGAATFCD